VETIRGRGMEKTEREKGMMERKGTSERSGLLPRGGLHHHHRTTTAQKLGQDFLASHNSFF